MDFQYRTEFVRVIDGPKGDRVEVLGCQDGCVSVEAGSPIGPIFVMPWQQALHVGQAIVDAAREKQRERGDVAPTLAVHAGLGDSAWTRSREVVAHEQARLCAWRLWASKHVGDAGRTDGEQQSLLDARLAKAGCHATMSLLDLLRALASEHRQKRPGLAESARDLADRLVVHLDNVEATQ